MSLQPAPRSRGVTAMALLLVVTAIWGGTFVVVHDVVKTEPVLSFLAWRFWLAAAVLIAIRPRAALHLSRAAKAHGTLLGIVLATGYITQTVGLRYASPTVSGFITGLFVVLTPVLAGPLLKRRISASNWTAVGLSTVGLALLSLNGLHLGIGEALTLVCAFAFALHIVGLGAWSTSDDAYGLTVLQVLVTAVVCTIGAPFAGGLHLPSTGSIWLSIAFLGIAATSFGFLVQTWAQSHLSPTRTAVVLTMEPVFAGIFGVTVAGDPLTWRVVVGGACIVTAMYVSELAPAAPLPPHLES